MPPYGGVDSCEPSLRERAGRPGPYGGYGRLRAVPTGAGRETRPLRRKRAAASRPYRDGPGDPAPTEDVDG